MRARWGVATMCRGGAATRAGVFGCVSVVVMRSASLRGWPDASTVRGGTSGTVRTNFVLNMHDMPGVYSTQTSHRQQAPPPPPPTPPPSQTAPPPPRDKQTNIPAPPDVHTAAGLPSHPSRSPRPRQLGAAAAAAGRPPSNSAPPPPAGASAAVRTPASGGSGDGGAMDHSPPPPPPPSQPPPVAVAAMAGATAAAAAAGEAAVALPAPFPAPNGGGARPPSDSGGGEEWGGTATGGAAVNAAAASARGRRRLGPCHIARDGRCGRRRGHPHARAGGWVGLVASSARRPTAPRLCWSRAVAYGRAREGCVGRVRPPRW